MSKKCELCGNNDAVVHIKQIIGNDIIEMRICEECAFEKGISTKKDKIELSLPDLLGGLLDQSDKKKLQPCPGCAATYEDIRKTGMLGCEKCYTHFRRELKGFLEKEYGAAEHVGRYPKKLQVYKEFIIDREKIKHKLQQAVADENYETAAQLRDELQHMEERQT